MNDCKFYGRIVDTLELREVRSESKTTSVLNFKICTRRRVRDGKGGFRLEKTYLDCEAWDSGAEIIANNFRQGDEILVEAFARNDRWVDKEGKKCCKTVFRVERFYLTPFENAEESEEVAQEVSS